MNFSDKENIEKLFKGFKEEITQENAFDSRQTNYYTDAVRYLNLVEKKNLKYTLSELGEKILSYNFIDRQLAYCKCILSHKIFYKTLKKFFDCDVMPNKNDVVNIMKKSNVHNLNSDETFERRSSTIRSWINWIIGLINE